MHRMSASLMRLLDQRNTANNDKEKENRKIQDIMGAEILLQKSA